jgi:hypothetical protein
LASCRNEASLALSLPLCLCLCLAFSSPSNSFSQMRLLRQQGRVCMSACVCVVSGVSVCANVANFVLYPSSKVDFVLTIALSFCLSLSLGLSSLSRCLSVSFALNNKKRKKRKLNKGVRLLKSIKEGGVGGKKHGVDRERSKHHHIGVHEMISTINQ